MNVERRDRRTASHKWSTWTSEPRPLPPISDLLSRNGIAVVTTESDNGMGTQYRVQREDSPAKPRPLVGAAHL